MIGASPERRSLDRPITTESQLLVEGRVPEMFFRELVRKCDLAGSIEVRTFGDISPGNLQAYLELLTSKAAFREKVRRLGIVRDAEGKTAEAAYRDVEAALRGAGLPVPGCLQSFAGSPVSVGVFILPNCKDAGMLETLCLRAAAEDADTNVVFPCVDHFFACLKERVDEPANPTKARFAAYALARDVIDPQLGRAAQQGAIPWAAAAFDPLRAFLRNLASPLGH